MKNGYCIYMDNLRVHTANLTKEYLEKNKISYLMAPVYSPEYNSIEFMFSHYKKSVEKQRL